jgi:hypothetical protein
MIASTRYLQLCRELKAAGWSPEFEPGTRLCRGYADLGFEEFLLLPNNRLVSLVNGSASKFPEAHRAHFYAIPSADALVHEIRRRGFDITSIDFADQRSFRIRAERSGLAVGAESRSFEEALAQTLLAVLGHGTAVC